MCIRSDAYVDQTPRFAGRGRFLTRCARLGLIQSICSFHRTRDQARTRVTHCTGASHAPDPIPCTAALLSPHVRAIL